MGIKYGIDSVKTVCHIDFPNYEKRVAQLPVPPIMANQIDTSTKEGVERLNNLLYTRYQGDVLSATPKCNCGELIGGYNKGLICGTCGTECVDVLDKPLETTLWIEVPDGIEKFIGPGFWIVLSKALTIANFNLLEWLVDSRYPDPPFKHEYSYVIEMLGIDKKSRNLNFFYHNFEGIMRRIVTYSILKKKPKNIPGISQEEIVDIYRAMNSDHAIGPEILTQTALGNKYRDEKKLALFVLKYIKQPERVFTRYLALPSALGIILETNNTGTWAETSLVSAIDAMYAITQIPLTLGSTKISMRNRRAVIATKKMAAYSESYIKESAGAKEGEFRRHICGGRTPFSIRAVITSINEPHRHDELWLPWVPAVQFFKLDIINKLTNEHNFSNRIANRMVEDSTKCYNSLIDSIMKQLIEESKGGVWVTFQRSPSLKKPSIQLLLITRVKTDVNDRTISMSINITNGPNIYLFPPIERYGCKPRELRGVPKALHTTT